MFEKVVLIASVIISLLSSNNTAKTEIVNHLHIWIRNLDFKFVLDSW